MQGTNEWIQLSRENDMEAFRKLVEAHQSLVYSVAFRMLCDSHEADDIVQETFIRVWKNLHKFDTKMRFTTWLYTIATNLCYDRLKAIKRRGNYLVCDVDKSILLNQSSNENVESTLINNELAQVIQYLTNQLTPKQKLVFTLRDLEGLEVEEITAITGLSPAKIKSNLYCARQFIREKLLNH